MTGKKKAAELHKRYGRLEYPIDIEAVTAREGLRAITWPFVPPVEKRR